MDERSEPWQQRPDESGPTYAAFSAYIFLGLGRSVVEAYRQSTGKAQANQASGCWNGWAKQHDWEARARAFDQRLGAVRQGAVEEATAADAATWSRRRDQHLADMWRIGGRLLRRAEGLIGDDGADIEPGRLRAVALIVSQCHEITSAVLAEALAVQAATPAARDHQQQVLDDAARRLEEWRASLRARVLKMPDGPPGINGAHCNGTATASPPPPGGGWGVGRGPHRLTGAHPSLMRVRLSIFRAARSARSHAQGPRMSVSWPTFPRSGGPCRSTGTGRE